MGMITALLSLASGLSGNPEALVFKRGFDAQPDGVFVSDVLELAQITPEMRDLAGKTMLFRLNPKNRCEKISEQQLAARLRAVLPALNPRLNGPYSGHLLPNGCQSRKMPIAEASGNQIGRSDSVRLVVSAGVVTVERPALAMEPAEQDGRLFVRTPDGPIAAIFRRVP